MVEEIFDSLAAHKMGIDRVGQVCAPISCCARKMDTVMCVLCVVRTRWASTRSASGCTHVCLAVLCVMCK